MMFHEMFGINVWRNVSMSLIGLQDDMMIMLLWAMDYLHGLRHDSMMFMIWVMIIYEFKVLLTWAWTWHEHRNKNGVTTLVVIKYSLTTIELTYALWETTWWPPVAMTSLLPQDWPHDENDVKWWTWAYAYECMEMMIKAW